MAVYKYKALKGNGEKIEGTFEGNSSNEVLAMLRENSYYPVDVQEVVEKDIRDLPFLNRIKTKDIAIFARQFYVMLNAGITIINCLDILRYQTENKKLRKIIENVYEGVQKGLTFSEALRQHQNIFPELMLNLVEAGEISGNLDIVMNRLATHFEKENKINNKIKGAMMYPIILAIVAVIVVVFLLTAVLPTFIGMFEGTGVELPLPTRMLLSLSAVIGSYWYLFILSIIAIVYILRRYVKTEGGKYNFDSLKLKIPVIKSLNEKIATTRFTRTLSTLLASGVSLIQALDIVAKVVGNKVVADGILIAKEEVRKGVDLSAPIKNIKAFSPMVTSMIMIGEESGTIDIILDKTADFYDEEVEAAIHKLTTLFEPLMIVVMAVIIGFIVISIALPMFDMIQTVQ